LNENLGFYPKITKNYIRKNNSSAKPLQNSSAKPPKNHTALRSRQLSNHALDHHYRHQSFAGFYVQAAVWYLYLDHDKFSQKESAVRGMSGVYPSSI
jgi:hypothetical protein